MGAYAALVSPPDPSAMLQHNESLDDLVADAKAHLHHFYGVDAALVAAADPTVAVAWVETAEAGSEYRGRDLPLWRVDFTGPEPVSQRARPI